MRLLFFLVTTSPLKTCRLIEVSFKYDLQALPLEEIASTLKVKSMTYVRLIREYVSSIRVYRIPSLNIPFQASR